MNKIKRVMIWGLILPIFLFFIFRSDLINAQTSPGVKVPVLNGMTEADAKSAILAAGLSFGGTKVGPQWARMPLNAGKVYKVGYSTGDILSESSEGTYVRPGAAITIYLLAAGVKVPVLNGMTEADAKSAILAAGLSFGGAKVGPQRAEKLSDAGRVYMSGHANSDILSESSEGTFLKYGAAITIYLLAAPDRREDRCGQIEAALIAASQAKDINRFRTLVEQARLENCNFYQSAYNHLRNWEQQLQRSATQPPLRPPQVSPIQRAWQGSWTLVSKHTGGKFKGASVRSYLTVSFNQNNQVKVTFGKYTVSVISIAPETLVYEVTSGGNRITTTLHRVGRGIKGNFQGVHVASGEAVMGEFRSDPPP